MTRNVDDVDGFRETATDRADPWWRAVWSRVHLWALVELFVLSGFAIAQPLLDVTGKSPDVFLFRRADRLDILLLVACVTLLPPLIGWAIETVVGLANQAARRLLHLTAVTGLLALLGLEVAKKLTQLRGQHLVAVAVAAGLAGGVLYARQDWVRLWLRYLAPAPVVFALLFLLVSPTSRLVLPARAQAPAGPAPAAASGAHPPVVMILFDEFPLSSLLDSKGRIDRRVYPNFAAFADQSTWYRNATGVSGFTPWAMPAMLTGNYPAKVKVPSYTEYPDNILTLFGRYYDLEAYETISQLCPPTQCRSTADNLERVGFRAVAEDSARVLKRIIQPYDAAVDLAFFVDQNDPRAVQAVPMQEARAVALRFNRVGLNQPLRFNGFLAGLKPSDRPTMDFLHILLPHAPWRYQPSGTEYNYEETFGLAFKPDKIPAPIIELGHQRHLLQLAYTDGLVGQVMRRLKAQGRWDKSLVVMGADHGQGWVPGEHSRTLEQRNAPDLMWVPMFIKAPGQDTGVVDDRNWEQVDLLPTVADLANIKVPWKTDGSSQTGRPTRARAEKWWYDIPGRREVRDGLSNWKLVLQGTTDTLVQASEGVRGLYRFGAFADRVYRSPASIGPIEGSPASAVLDDYQLYGQIKPASGKVPALVSGTLDSPLPPAGSTVLVAVNGKIAGESRLFPERPGDPATKFAVIAPDFLFQAGDGRRQLQVYIVDRGVGGPRLRPVTLSSG